jgi:hypothetical protein
MLKKSPAVMNKVRLVRIDERSCRAESQHTQPNDNELNAETVGGLLAVVLDDLRRKDNDPARDGNRA